MTRLEAASLLAGTALLVVVLAAVVWRLGGGALAVFLILSSLDIRPRRRA